VSSANITDDRLKRRAFIFARAIEGGEIARQAEVAGYVMRRAMDGASPSEALRAISEFAPDVVMIAVRTGASGESEELALFRRLRAEPQFFALPIVVLHREDTRPLRSLALSLGADDYFAANASPEEIRARLDALFWRAEVGRRHAPVVADQRSEIDNFVALLDSVRADAASGTVGTLALIEAVLRSDATRAVRDETLQKAHGFLKLNLRRIDAVAFYGPTTLLVYLPGMATGAARVNLNRLRSEFLNTRPPGDIAIGLASFPSDANDVENLIEKAEAGVVRARLPEARTRIVSEGEANIRSPVKDVDSTREAKPMITGEPKTNESLPAPVEPSSRAVGQNPDGESAIKVSARPATREMPSPPLDSAKPDGPLSAEEAAARERERRAAGTPMPRRVLLAVSDAARLAQLNSLMRAAGYEIRAAFDAQQALDFLRLELPDLLLLDHELRDMTGLEMLARLRKQTGDVLPVPVMMIAPVGNEIGMTREAISLGARRVVALPCDPAEFLASVRTTGNVE
jgi:DNA-binding response OmpR family regulator